VAGDPPLANAEVDLGILQKRVGFQISQLARHSNSPPPSYGVSQVAAVEPRNIHVVVVLIYTGRDIRRFPLTHNKQSVDKRIVAQDIRRGCPCSRVRAEDIVLYNDRR
jgi:hypothetical protein